MITSAARFVASVLFLSGLDDLWVDLNFLFKPPDYEIPNLDEINSATKKKVAIFVPAWQESGVIGPMLRHSLQAIDYPDYDIFVGVYPNDQPTEKEVEEVSRIYPRVHKIVCPHDGPTNKADNLNWLFQGMRVYEKRVGWRYEIIVVHDSEDIIHPLSLKLYNFLLTSYDMVQIPVFPLEMPIFRHWVYGSYMDEFAENHTKDLLVRGKIGGLVPSAGVGTAFSRDALEELAEQYQNQIFNVQNLTEDYEIGVRLLSRHKKIIFLEGIKRRHGHRWVFETVATREYFPCRLREALRQKSRWIVGITLQTWEQSGWPGNLVQKYTIWRDRKALLTNLVNVLAYIVAFAWLLDFSLKKISGITFLSEPFFPHSSIWWWLIVADTIFMAERLFFRFFCVRRVYGRKQAWASLLRTFVSNWVNFLATTRAINNFVVTKVTGRVIPWTKTAHAFPTEEQLREYRRRLGELLVAKNLISENQLQEALSRQQESKKRLGEILIEAGYIQEEDLFIVLSEQQQVPWVEIDLWALDPSLKRVVSYELARQYSILPLARSNRELLVASPEVFSAEKREELQAVLGYKLHFRLTSPSDFLFHLERYYRLTDGRRLRLGSLLLSRRLISPEKLREALRQQKKSGRPLGVILLELNLIDQETLDLILAEQTKLLRFEPEALFIPLPLLIRLPEATARTLKALPVDSIGEVVLAASAQSEETVRIELEKYLGRRVFLVPMEENRLQKTIDLGYKRLREMGYQAQHLGDFLLSKGLLSNSALEGALEEQRLTGRKLGEILVNKQLISAEQLALSLAELRHLPFLKVNFRLINREFVRKHFFPSLLRERWFLPLYVNAHSELLVAMEDPLDFRTRELVSLLTRYPVAAGVASLNEIKQGIELVFGPAASHTLAT